ncbi:hypothetical protein E2C01_006021 [Portunus trituberculatus]|uniref:Uncharacterized protein n=1 Tax=Portunus trituberculatus TaxID=210409 RepID=A0A5B7CU61_PORTR|nr:hypothetical protein [Portunus trituberculatus]
MTQDGNDLLPNLLSDSLDQVLNSSIRLQGCLHLVAVWQRDILLLQWSHFTHICNKGLVFR